MLRVTGKESLVSCLVVLLSINATAVQAQNKVDGKRLLDNLTNPSLNIEHKSKGGEAAVVSDNTYQHMDKAPKELPGVPLPSQSNSQFAFGLQKPESGATTILLRYKMKQSKAEIIGSYREGLKASGWAVGSQKNADQFTAVLHGNKCSIQVMDYGGGGYPSALAIFYTLKTQ